MTRSAKVGGSKAVVDGYSAAVATFVLQEVCAMFRTHLRTKGSDTKRKGREKY